MVGQRQHAGGIGVRCRMSAEWCCLLDSAGRARKTPPQVVTETVAGFGTAAWDAAGNHVAQ